MDQFHDLMHWPFEPCCWNQYGGPVQHIRLWFEYRLPYLLGSRVYSRTLCRIGRHHWVTGWKAPKGGWSERPPSQETIEREGISFTRCEWCHHDQQGRPSSFALGRGTYCVLKMLSLTAGMTLTSDEIAARLENMTQGDVKITGPELTKKLATLQEIGWIAQESQDAYAITDEGRETLER